MEWRYLYRSENKFQVSKFEDDMLIQKLFDQLNGQKFIDWLQDVMQVEDDSKVWKYPTGDPVKLLPSFNIFHLK